jgi:hypothetical protein
VKAAATQFKIKNLKSSSAREGGFKSLSIVFRFAVVATTLRTGDVTSLVSFPFADRFFGPN